SAFAAPARPGIIPLAVALAAAAPPAPAVASIEPLANPDPFANPWAGLKRSAVEAPPPAPVETPEERAALLAEAEARGRAEGLAEARAEAEARLEQERAAFETRFAEARRQWSESEAESLASGFAAALRALDAELTGRIARLLVPVLTDALRRRAVAELGDALQRLLADPQAAQVRVSGPEDLLAALGDRLGPLADTIAFAPGEATEVSVVADQTVIETQLAAWTRLLAAAVAES
ncbi:hypothetical protein, partial [Methylobacterium symbioticum]|uniref:hypothetical protein n=2 Tax=Methylobacterium TaxID=407 RepID=UPI0027B96D8B